MAYQISKRNKGKSYTHKNPRNTFLEKEKGEKWKKVWTKKSITELEKNSNPIKAVDAI